MTKLKEIVNEFNSLYMDKTGKSQGLVAPRSRNGDGSIMLFDLDSMEVIGNAVHFKTEEEAIDFITNLSLLTILGKADQIKTLFKGGH